ncbi:MAG TPA: Crp/Fnr family transcriptional regulator [Candidatus Merdenecus merdavium]|nr:Crp/Fnr family transcriptional regulator [Candidatus Merdenecus merdavium]
MDTKILKLLEGTALFHGLTSDMISNVLGCLGAKTLSFQKDEFLLLADQSKPVLGVVLSGSIQIIKENILGDRMIIGVVKEGELFAETYAAAGIDTIPVSIAAIKDSQVLYLDVHKIMMTCSKSCEFHHQMTKNLLQIIAQKNMILNTKMQYLSHKTIRDRLDAYFLDQIQKNNSTTFTIPFTITQLADYLCVNRSALSRELGNMQKEGLLEYRKKTFTYQVTP